MGVSTEMGWTLGRLRGDDCEGLGTEVAGLKDIALREWSLALRAETLNIVREIAMITEFNIRRFAYMVNKMANLREGDGTLLDNCIMMWGSGLEDGNVHTRENLPFVIAGKGGGSIRTGRYFGETKGNQGDLLTTLLACAGVPNDRPVGIATKQIEELKAQG